MQRIQEETAGGPGGSPEPSATPQRRRDAWVAGIPGGVAAGGAVLLVTGTGALQVCVMLGVFAHGAEVPAWRLIAGLGAVLAALWVSYFTAAEHVARRLSATPGYREVPGSRLLLVRSLGGVAMTVGVLSTAFILPILMGPILTPDSIHNFEPAKPAALIRVFAWCTLWTGTGLWLLGWRSRSRPAPHGSPQPIPRGST